MKKNYSLNEVWDRGWWALEFAAVNGAICGVLLGIGSYLVLVIVLPLMLYLGRSLFRRWLEEVLGHVKGIIGEIKVDAVLGWLDEDKFKYLNRVILEGMVKSDIDHLVVGRTGIWLIETKEWEASSLLGYSNKLKRKIGELRAQAAIVKDLLVKEGIPIRWVNSILVFSRESIEIHDALVRIVPLKNLIPLIEEGLDRPVLSDDDWRKALAVIKKYDKKP
ncbi:MAG: nuclease-related domain-containing protein [bacterium]